MPQLEITDVHKHYGEGGARYHALRGVSFGVEAGGFVALRGPSGCGKSTLLHIAGAMDRPTDGQVLLEGERLDRLTNEALARVRRRSVGFVFQAFNLLPTLTAAENVALPLLLDGVADGESAARSRAALDEVGLASKERSFPSQLSGGEMQRVAIARAVAIEPRLLVADEPTGSLDSENGRRVLDLLAELNRSRGLTILMATHSDEAAAYASRTLGIRDGLLQDTPAPGGGEAGPTNQPPSVSQGHAAPQAL
ncbi:MAG: ABC transporter ATP-binding protein [Planctomycetota bacterium]